MDRVELATGAVDHVAVPADAEPRGAFGSVVADAAGHPLLAAPAWSRRAAVRLSDVTERRALIRSALYGDYLHRAGVEYEIAIGARTGRGEAVVAGLGRTEREFSERDRDVLDIACTGLEAAVLAMQARERRLRARRRAAAEARSCCSTATARSRSQPDAARWLAEHFGAGEHPGWLPRPVAEWLALPPRPPLVSEREGRRLTVWLLPGDPHALLLEEAVTSFRAEALDRLSLTARETEVLRAAPPSTTRPSSHGSCSSTFTRCASGWRAWRASSTCRRRATRSPGRCARALSATRGSGLGCAEEPLACFGPRHRVLITIAGSLAAAAVLGFLLAGHRHEFTAALSSVTAAVLAVTVVLQVVALLARTEAWHLTVEAAGGTIDRRVLYRASSMQVLGSVLNSQLGVAARIAALRRSSPRSARRCRP